MMQEQQEEEEEEDAAAGVPKAYAAAEPAVASAY
jgi:hypothetical protein